MIVRDEKGKKEREVYCPQTFREFVESLPINGKHLLSKNLTEPLSYQAVETMFRIWRKTLGERAQPYSLLGLRKLSIVQPAEAGALDAEIQAVTGQSAEMVAYYRAKASRKALSKAAQIRRE